MTIGVYPGSFNPPTVAHVAIAEAARRQCGLVRLDVVVSAAPLGKPTAAPDELEARLTVLRRLEQGRPWLRTGVTPDRLVADIARGYDLVVVGADKWEQLRDPSWYGSEVARDEALAALPRLAIAPRHGVVELVGLPPRTVVLDLADEHRQVSASAVRAGRSEWQAPEVDRG